MSYQIGQLRSSDITSENEYFKKVDVNITHDIILNTTFSDISFIDVGLSSSDSNFLTIGNNYYLNFTIDRYEQGTFNEPTDPTIDTIEFTICLLKTNTATEQFEIEQTLDSFTVLPYPPGETAPDKKVINFEVMFSPMRDELSRIGFILKRKKYDYKGEGEAREVRLTVNSYGIIQNILSRVPGIGLFNANKIGVQAKPGFLMCINGERIRVGRTGIYEINNGVPVSFFGIAYLKEPYILDCAWDS